MEDKSKAMVERKKFCF